MAIARKVDVNNIYVDDNGILYTKYGQNSFTSNSVASHTSLRESNATRTLDYTRGGGVVFTTATSGTQTYTLPDCTALQGGVFTFILAATGTELLINPPTGQKISIKASEGGAAVTTTAGTGIKNTLATQIKGDRITLISDGVDTWWAIMQSGTWASQ